MNKYLTIGALVTAAVCLVGMWYAMNQALSAREQIGWSKALNVQLNTDNAALIAQSQIMVNAFQKTQEGLKGLAAIKDESASSSSVSYAVDSVCRRREAAGLPCRATPPTKPAVPKQ